MKQLTQKDVTDDVKSAVNTYLVARAYAETMRDQVDTIDREILVKYPLYDGRHNKGRQILEGKDVYLCIEKENIKFYYAEADQRLKELGIKPEAMDLDHCPALVAEDIQRNASGILIRAAVEMLDLDDKPEAFRNNLLCLGMKKYREFIDLVVKYKAPSFA